MDAVRYSVHLKSVEGEAGTVASGRLADAGEGRFAGEVTLDAEGIYQLRVTGSRNGTIIGEGGQDFKYAFPPVPAPRLPLIDGERAEVRVESADAPYSLVVDTAAGLRIEVSRGDELLGRTTAGTDRVEVDIRLVEGENPLTVRAWRRQASAETKVTLNVVVDGDAPRRAEPVDVAGLCRSGAWARAWRGRGRLGADAAEALAPCLVRGAAQSGAWTHAADLSDRPARALADWPLEALVVGARANARERDADARDRLWRAVVERIAERGDEVVDGDAAEALGERIHRSGASDGVLLPCVEHGDPGHPCHRLLEGADAGDDRPPEPTPDSGVPAPVADAGSPAPPGDGLVTACAARDHKRAADLFLATPDAEMTRPTRLCVALGLRQSGRCGDALTVAEPLTGATVYETAPALQVVAGCQAALGRKADAARSWQRAVAIALAGGSSFLMGPERVRRDLDAAGLDDAQRAAAVEPCGRAPDHTLCQALVDEPEPSATLEELCRSGDRQGAARHPDAADPHRAMALCVARGLAEIGQAGRGRALLREATRAMEPSAELGQASRLLASLSANQPAVDAMKRAVEMMAQSLYVVDDAPRFYDEIRAVRGPSAVDEIIEPCRAASRREACAALLRHFDRKARPEPKPDASLPPPPATPVAEPPDADKKPPPVVEEAAPDVVGRPAGTRLVLHLDGGRTLERSTRSGSFAFEEKELPAGAVRFTLSAGGRQNRTGTLNLRARKVSEGPVRLYAHRAAAHGDYSAGEQALVRGDAAAAAAAFTRATRADSEFCLGYAYLGYAQGLAGQLNQAKGSFARCTSSLDNDLAAVATAGLLRAVVELRAGIDEASPDQLEGMLRRLRGSYGGVRYANKVLPSTKRGAINLGTIYKVWSARGQTAHWQKLAESEAPPEKVEAVCRAARKAWQAIPASQLRYVGARLTDTRSDFAEERGRSMAALGAACD